MVYNEKRAEEDKEVRLAQRVSCVACMSECVVCACVCVVCAGNTCTFVIYMTLVSQLWPQQFSRAHSPWLTRPLYHFLLQRLFAFPEPFIDEPFKLNHKTSTTVAGVVGLMDF